MTGAWLRNNKRERGRVCPAPSALRSGRKIASVSRGGGARAAGRELSGTHCQVSRVSQENNRSALIDMHQAGEVLVRQSQLQLKEE